MIRDNDDLAEQAQNRRNLCARLDTFYKNLPKADMDVADALDSGLVHENDVVALYESLSDLLEHDPESARIVLYIPFEILPSRTPKAGSETLQKAAKRFADLYMHHWKELLPVRDVRANFVDGDVLETSHRTGDLPRVVKAAHLLPKLVEKNLVTNREILSMMEQAPESTLRDSIADTIPVIADMGLLSQEDLDHMSRSADPLTRNMGRIITADNEASHRESPRPPITVDLSNIPSALDKRFADIDAHPADGITKARYDWLSQEEKRRSIEYYSHTIAASIIDGSLTPEETARLVANPESPSTLAVVHGIRESIETSAKEDRKSAVSLYANYGPILADLWKSGSHKIKDPLTSTFSRLGSLGVVSGSSLERLGVIVPELGGPSSQNISKMRTEIREISAITKSIESNPRLAQMVYPVSLLFGSRLKGYGAHAADIDAAVFVRPGTPLSDRPQLQTLLKETFAHEKIQGKVVEFWLEEQEDSLAVRDLPDAGPSLGESTWTHILFGAAWCGDQTVIKELHEKLLTPYLYAKDAMIGGRSARSIWLEEMERDALQYRLMHKGYARFFPEQGGIHTPHSDAIDSDSAFWDSGYRRVATKIFAGRVFLPHLEKSDEAK